MQDSPIISDATFKATALLIAMGRPLAQRLVAKLNEEELRKYRGGSVAFVLFV